MVSKPQNHATRAAHDRVFSKLAAQEAEPLPDIDLGLLECLERLYRPRCYTGSETLETHLLYAGAVGLIQVLRNTYDVADGYSSYVVLPQEVKMSEMAEITRRGRAGYAGLRSDGLGR